MITCRGDLCGARELLPGEMATPFLGKDWSGREDLNLLPPGPEPDSASCGTILNLVGQN